MEDEEFIEDLFIKTDIDKSKPIREQYNDASLKEFKHYQNYIVDSLMMMCKAQEENLKLFEKEILQYQFSDYKANKLQELLEKGIIIKVETYSDDIGLNVDILSITVRFKKGTIIPLDEAFKGDILYKVLKDETFCIDVIRDGSDIIELKDDKTMGFIGNIRFPSIEDLKKEKEELLKKISEIENEIKQVEEIK